MNNNNGAKTLKKPARENNVQKLDPNLWILPYSDFMTIIMIFFLAMYVLSKSADKIQNEMLLVSLEESLGGKVSDKKKMIEAAGSIESSINTRGLKQLVNLEINSQKVKIIMAAPIIFASGSADIGEKAKPLLDELSGILKQMPNKVTVEGHTDDLPVSSRCKYKSNLELSGARAFSFIKYMIDKEKLDPERFAALGCGESFPLLPNDSAEHRALNRRVEISIEK